MPDLTLRKRQPEIMDDPTLGPSEHEQALNGLARIHRLTNMPAQVWRDIRPHVVTDQTKIVLILDVGCGDGYLLRQLHALASREGLTLELAGCDFSLSAIKIARKAAENANIPIEFYHFDVTRNNGFPIQADVVFCSLFLHHFSETEVIQIMQAMDAAAKKFVLIHDLRRTRLGYVMCWIGVHLFSRSTVVHTDGLRSVEAAFSILEIEKLLKAAEISHARIATSWLQRFNITWSKSEQIK